MTKPGEGFGVSLSGGVNGYYGNPLDETDEGIFISQVQTTCTACCVVLPWESLGLVVAGS